ncbi:MAG: restriction endonuclease [Polyangiaceae bacterium]|nr:restriction endonuclease [Polyangiaceae bacterium]
MVDKTKTLREAAVELLRAHGPKHYQALTEEILAKGLASSSSKTPAASLNAMIAVDIKRNGGKSEFVRLRPGVFGLRALHAAAATPDRTLEDLSPGADGTARIEPKQDDTEHRVRTPLFPTYAEVRHLLRVWPGRPKKQVTGLQATLAELRGTPQNTVDWTEPDQWIPERLKDADRELAHTIWTSSGKSVNPRHTYGHWLLVQKYELVQGDDSGVLRLTERGQDFLEHEGGDTEAFLDEQEGLAKLLALVADNGPTRAGGLLEEWTEYLTRHSAFGSDSTFRDTLRRRLNNLLDRGLIARKGTLYSINDAGLAYLQRVGTEEALGGDEQQQLWTLVKKQQTAVRESLRELLLDMDPFAFEHLVKRLLEEMDYQNVQVTTRSGDGGVDVVADIELGITSVREVVQAKRHKRTVQRKDLDALRGSLYRFNAVRGTIIATAPFSKGTAEAAFATGAAPITLIDGDKLIDLLIEHGIGVKKSKIEVLSVDADAFADLEPEA